MADLDARIRAKLADRPWITADMGVDAAGRANDWITEARDALLAVLDLHKPTEEMHETVCGDCNGWSGVTARYPCPTVRAIAERLGVEVEHD